MVRLPNPGGDNGTWGNLLNEFLSVEHNVDGSLKQAATISQAIATANSKYTKPSGGIPESDLTSAAQAKLNGIGTGSITASSITDSTATGRSVITAVDAAAARTAIGAGTSSLVIGTTGTTAKAGDAHDALDNLTDVSTSGATNGQSLVFNSGTWAPATVSGGGGGGTYTGPQFFVQSTDPGNAAANGDIWIDTSL